MSFILLAFTILLLFLQPVSIYPELAVLNPIRNMILISIVAFVLVRKKTEITFINNNTNKYFLLFVAMQIISPMSAWIGSVKESLITWLLYVFIYYLIVHQCNTLQRVRTIVLMIVLAVSYLSYYSLTHFVADYQPGGRAGGFGWYENPNDLALILVCSIPLVMLLAESASSYFSKIFWFLIAGMFVFNVLFTGSRSGILGISLVTGLGLYFSNLTAVLKKVIAVVMLFAVLGTGISVITSRGDLQGLHGDDSSENRLVQWEAGIRMLIANPFLGVGPDEFEGEAEQYGGIKGLAPHNTLIQVFAETGFLGGIFFVLFACNPIYQFLRRLRDQVLDSSVDIQRFQNFIFSAICGFWVCAFFSNRYKSYIIFVLIALLVVVRDYLFVVQQDTDKLKIIR